MLTNCSQLQLELNFHTLGRRPVDLRIENSGNVRVSEVELAAWEEHNAGVDGLAHVHMQGLKVQGVKELVLQGAISCPRCNSFTLISQSSFVILPHFRCARSQEGLLNIQVSLYFQCFLVIPSFIGNL